MALSHGRAERLVAVAAQRSPAYRILLSEHGLPPPLAPGTPLSSLPVLDKDNTFGRFSLDQLAGELDPADVADVLTSSGRGGRTFGYRITTRKPHESSWFDIDLGLQDAFRTDDRSTLLVNCLPMGVVFRSRAVAVANVSVREDMACAILKSVGPAFNQTIVCCDPLFAKRLLDHAQSVGVDWNRLNTSMIVGEEVLTEAQRTYFSIRLGINADLTEGRLVASSFGVGELGLNLLFETRETIAIRRAMRRSEEVAAHFGIAAAAQSVPSVFCFNPLRCHVEILEPDPQGFGELCITALDTSASILLPRYRTGDLARLISVPEMLSAESKVGCKPWLPALLLRGRIADRGPTGPDVETVKELVFSCSELADQLTGAFRITTTDDGTLITLQLMPGGDLQTARDLAGELKLPASMAVSTACRIIVETSADLQWGPPVDHERKFAYRPA